jgi:hypothetical protein
VRGLRRVTHLIIGSALMVNLRRIHRHLIEQRQQQQLTDRALARDSAATTPLAAFFVALRQRVALLCRWSTALRTWPFMTQQTRLMNLLAHPDDESSAMSGVLAKYAAEGVATYLVTTTRGE